MTEVDASSAGTRLVGAVMRVLKSTGFRVLLALAILAGLFALNRIDLAVLGDLAESWHWLVAALALMMPTYLIVSCRFWLVLRMQGLGVPFGLALRWTMIGSFFDLAMPSNSGGDLVKAAYVARHAGPGMRMHGVMAVAFDRVLGLIGLFMLATFAVFLGWTVVQDMAGSMQLLIVLPLVSFGSLIFFRVAGSRRLLRSRRFGNLMMRSPGGKLLLRVVESFNLLRERPGQFFAVLGLSMLNHVFWCASLLCITGAFGLSLGVFQGFAAFPLAIFGNTFGFAGGFGVGTAAFDLVFSTLLHAPMGAAVGLTFQLLGALSRLSGLPVYLLHSAHTPSPSATESDQAAT